MIITQDQLIYHRGKVGVGAPENSLQAMLFAAAEGATMVEFDVQEDLKIAHDPGASEDTLRLPDLLLALGGQVQVVIDIKDPACAGRILAAIRSAIATGRWRPEQFVVSSFCHNTVHVMKSAYSALRAGVTMEGVPLASYVHMLAQLRLNLHIDWKSVLMDRANNHFIRKVAQADKVPIWVYTVNDRAVAEEMLDYGAARIFTDRPDLLLG